MNYDNFMTPALEIGEGLVLDNRFLVGRPIGEGGFGTVYLGHDLQARKEVAIKVEPERISILSKDLVGSPLKNERTVLKDMDGASGFCNVYGFEIFDRRDTYLVMDLLGPTVLQLFCLCSKQFTLKTLLLLTDQMILRVEKLHSRGYIHRDLKPENFMMGVGPEIDTVYLIDFGLGGRFRNPGNYHPTLGDHVKPGLVNVKIGSTRYMSLGAHGRYQQSRKDDLESLVYVLAFFANRGNLPWMKIESGDARERNIKVRALKKITKPSQLFEGLPKEFASFAKKVNDLGFEETPKYQEYRNSFRQLATSLGHDYDGDYDWKVLKVVEVPPTEQNVTEEVHGTGRGRGRGRKSSQV